MKSLALGALVVTCVFQPASAQNLPPRRPANPTRGGEPLMGSEQTDSLEPVIYTCCAVEDLPGPYVPSERGLNCAGCAREVWYDPRSMAVAERVAADEGRPGVHLVCLLFNRTYGCFPILSCHHSPPLIPAGRLKERDSLSSFKTRGLFSRSLPCLPLPKPMLRPLPTFVLISMMCQISRWSPYRFQARKTWPALPSKKFYRLLRYR